MRYKFQVKNICLMYDARRQKVSLNSWLDKKRKKKKDTGFVRGSSS